ncbi:glycosyltransferase [Terrimonas sp. NA20]|uniref:Glycosyltransferase n=1 Tax=Terrimonas ginsenosidimutans TaxID=2908004 RepID=A0ABS9KNS4_9BACT|nr:glycosyltransferase family 2 protein [Terrimonas ginsenosidimutans]MCG2613982.1 glycosyltransferase [Terrimonas ginsenosidimutans]
MTSFEGRTDNYPRITIVTPSFNQGQYIEDTIKSVLDQGYPHLEYFVIDGGSTDNTLEVIKKYEDRITYWISEKDSGQSNAINKGFRRATGDIINWINSDDQLMPGSLHAIAGYFNQHKDVALVHGRIEYFGEGITSFTSTNLSTADLENRYIAHICMPQPASFYRKQLLDEQGLLDETLHFSMDTDLFVRAGLHYKILQVEDVFSRFRLHAASKSVSGFNKKFLTDNQLIFSRVLATLKAAPQIEQMKQLGLFVEPGYVYQTPKRSFDGALLLFYFLEHRLRTLYFQGDRKEFKRLFKFILNHYPIKTLTAGKLVAYRLLLFLPSTMLHRVSRFLTRKAT